MSLAFKGRMWMMGGWYNGRLPGHSASAAVWSSTDGAHWKQVTRQAKVDTELQNHPLMDNFTQKLEMLKQRKPGQPNPFVIGQNGYSRFVGVMEECMKAEVVRREEAGAH